MARHYHFREGVLTKCRSPECRRQTLYPPQEPVERKIGCLSGDLERARQRVWSEPGQVSSY